MKYRKKLILMLSIINVLFCAVSYAKGVNKELSDDLLRLHILANSDNEADQEIKIKVRDMVLFEMKDKRIASKTDAIENIEMLEKKVNNYLLENKINYSAKIVFENSVFPKKEYSGFYLPCGKYDCIKILLGKAKGHNWWCVAYPPLCFEDKKDLEKLKKILPNEEYKIIYSKSCEYKIRFLAVDVVNLLINKMY